MKALDPSSQRVIEEARSADRPAPDLEARLWDQLSQRLDQPLPPTAAAASQALGAAPFGPTLFGFSAKLVIGWLAAGCIGLLGTLWSVSHRPVPASTRAVPHAPTVLAAPRTATGEGAMQARPTPALEAPQPSAADNSTLADEVRLVAEAQRALNGGAAKRALRLIDQHALRFANGHLSQERDATRVLALCALGRSSEAQTERRRFLQAWPGSPLRARLLARCEALPGSSRTTTASP
jgi:hypothetical protein